MRTCVGKCVDMKSRRPPALSHKHMCVCNGNFKPLQEALQVPSAFAARGEAFLFWWDCEHNNNSGMTMILLVRSTMFNVQTQCFITNDISYSSNTVSSRTKWNGIDFNVVSVRVFIFFTVHFQQNANNIAINIGHVHVHVYNSRRSTRRTNVHNMCTKSIIHEYTYTRYTHPYTLPTCEMML